tara:strand:+ start:391 stop:5268 length:4878 start_codon:yes stop_codon:yes gene_type:complete
MANISVTTTNPVVNVNSTTNTVNVSSVVSNVLVASTATVPTSVIRDAISVTDAGGDGSLSYSNTTGIITYTGPNDTDYREAISVSDSGGDGSLSYDEPSGIISYSGPSAAEVRAHLSNTSPILYNASTGVIGIDSTVLLQDTFVDLGNQSGNVAIDSSLGDNFRLVLTGDLTGFVFSDVNNGDGFTVVIEQDGVAGHQIDTTTHSSLWTDFNFVNDYKTLDSNPNNWNIITIVYDGTAGKTAYYGSLVTETAIGIQNSDLANSNVTFNGVTVDLGSSGSLDTDNIAEGSTNQYYTDARSRAALSVTQASASGAGTLGYNDGTGVFTYTPPDLTAFGLTNAEVVAHIATVPLTVGGNLTVNGNIDATGNLNYQNVTDLYVTDQQITLNANATTDANVLIIANRPQTTSTDLKWNEQTDKWTFTNDGSTYYNIATSTTDVAEGTNLYYTDARSQAALSVTTGSAVSGGSLAYNNTSGIFTFGPSTGIDLDELSVTSISASGDGALAYNDTSGVFTFTPADTSLFSKDTSNLAEGTNLYWTTARGNAQTLAYTGALPNLTGNVTTTANVSGAYILGDGSQLTNLPDDTISETVQRLCIATETIVKGQAVCITGGTGDNPNVSLTNASNVSLMPAIGIALENIASSATGNIALYGEVFGIDTSVFAVGESLYISASIAGALTNVAPTGEENLIQKVGKVVRSNANGIVMVQGAGRTNATPNLNDGNFFLGNASNKAVSAVFTDESNSAISAYTGAINNVTGNITTTANISGAYILGDGSALTNLPAGLSNAQAKAYIESNGLSATANLTTTANVSGAYIFGDGSALTNLPAGLSNAQVVAYIESNGLSATANLTTTANVSGNFFIGDGSQLTNIPGHLTNAQAQAYIQTNGLTMTANITSNSNIETSATILTDNINQAGTGITGLNLSLSNSASAVNVNMPLMANSNVNVMDLTSDGYSAFVYNYNKPANGGSAAQYSGSTGLGGFVANATVTAGNTEVVIDAICSFKVYSASGSNSTALFTDAANITTVLNTVPANIIPKTFKQIEMTQAPFAKGTYITAVDAANAKITVSEAPLASATLTTLTGRNTTSQSALWLQHGAYNTDIKYAEVYTPLSDLTGDDVTDSNTEIYYGLTVSLDQYGTPPIGYATTDLTYTTGTSSDYTAATYTTTGRSKVGMDSGVLNAPNGFTVGNSTTNSYKGFNDSSGATFGLNVGWDGLSAPADYGGVGTSQPQVGIIQYTDNSTQESSNFIGPRLFFSSRTGNVNVSDVNQYPLSGQELGRITFWGSHGNNISPPSNSPPAYISAAAQDDWTTGSNCNMYLVGTSNYTSTTSREPFLTYETGEVIIASGTKETASANIQFAPAVKINSNPQNAYDFSSDAGSSGSQGWASINYADLSNVSGAKFSVNNGKSLGAGTVGDMKLSLHRRDNSYTLANSNITISEMIDGATAVSFGGPNNDLVGVDGGASTGTANLHTFSGITDGDWTFLNGNTYQFADSIFGSNYKQIKQIGGAAVVQGGSYVDPLVGGGQYTFTNGESSGVTDKEWTFELAEQSENLTLKAGTINQITFTDTETQFATTAIPVLPSYSNVSLPGAGTAGGMIFVTNGNNKPAYSNGSAWLYTFDNSAVT